MGISRAELIRAKSSAANWSERDSDLLGGLVSGSWWTPIASVAKYRDERLSQKLEELFNVRPIGLMPTLHEVENLLTRAERHLIAEVLFDWTAWTMRHGLGPGIMTALKNGQREQVLEAIEKDLRGAGE